MAIEAETNPCDTDGAAHAFDLTLERIIDASPEKVFRAYTDPAILAQWFAPKPWKIVDPIIEARVGGRFNFTMHGPDGEVFPNSGVFPRGRTQPPHHHHRRLHLRVETGRPALHGRPRRHGADR
ncbi:SRPBCC domain-containing protein [Brevundimonas sp. TWP2-3-4b1]|uniref:SRPBCC domain-containing protein n=1 Tax=Brevundimonas sp. TWP2-3-4b1 TaxID=2804580 RepID=UPI003CECDC4E